MTALEMKYDFLLKADEIGILNNKSFNDAEVDWLLNDSVGHKIRTTLNPINNPLGKGVEEIQKRIDDISTLIIRYPEQPEIPLLYHDDVNIYELDLNNLRYKYLYYLSGTVKQHKDNCVYNSVLRRVQSHNFEDSLKDPFNASNSAEILINFGRNSSGTASAIYLYPSLGYVLTNARLSYIKEPKRIHQGTYENFQGVNPGRVDCELPEIVHPEIVNIAVQKAAAIMKDVSLYQIFQQQILTQE